MRYLVVIEVDDLKLVSTFAAQDAGEALSMGMENIGDQYLEGIQHIKMEVAPVEERKDA